MRINLHIIGVQKAGTTALAHYLDQHPDIYVVDGKEAHVFDHPDIFKHQNKREFADRKYRQVLSKYDEQPIICDATPITIYHPEFLQACFDYNPQAKFILLLRDPVERAISHYHMARGVKAERRNMLIAFLLEPFRLFRCKTLTSCPFGSPPRTQSYLRRGLYFRQLLNLYETVPRQQILVITHTELKQSHERTLESIFAFLGVSPCSIKSETVFATDKIYTHWSDFIARIYAKCYFFLARKTVKRDSYLALQSESDRLARLLAWLEGAPVRLPPTST